MTEEEKKKEFRCKKCNAIKTETFHPNGNMRRKQILRTSGKCRHKWVKSDFEKEAEEFERQHGRNTKYIFNGKIYKRLKHEI